MRATEFEFRYRSLIILAIYLIGISLYQFGHENVVTYLLRLVSATPAGLGRPSVVQLKHGLFGFGAFLVFFAALVRTWAAAYLQSNVVQDPGMHLERLVADGPYRYVRNPLYLGAILQGFGLSLLANPLGCLFIAFGLAFFVLRLTGLEEEKLRTKQGESYREYCKRVPRLWPSLAPRLPAGNVEPQRAQAFLGEIHMWGFFAGIAVYAITLDPRVTSRVLGAALAMYAIRSYVLYTRRKRNAQTSP